MAGVATALAQQALADTVAAQDALFGDWIQNQNAMRGDGLFDVGGVTSYQMDVVRNNQARLDPFRLARNDLDLGVSSAATGGAIVNANGNILYTTGQTTTSAVTSHVTIEDITRLCSGSAEYRVITSNQAFEIYNNDYRISNNVYYGNQIPVEIREPDPPARPVHPTPAQLDQWQQDCEAHARRLEGRREDEIAAIAEANRQRELLAARHRDEQIARAAAERKAEELLAAHLAPEQLDQYRREKRFEVVLNARFGLSSKRYRIDHGWAGNVYLLDKDGREVERICIHHREQVPIPDLLLAQKLMLETDEEQFLTIGNRTRLAV